MNETKMKFWSDGSARRLSGNDDGCCLCLLPTAGVEGDPRTVSFVSIDSVYEERCSYRRIVDDCFRIRTPPSASAEDESSFIVCRSCASLLERTWHFFERIKSAQCELQAIAAGDVSREIKRESADIEDDSVDYKTEEGGLVKSESCLENYDADPSLPIEPLIEIRSGKEDRTNEKTKRKVRKNEADNEKRAKEKRAKANGDEVTCKVCGEEFPVHKLLVTHMSVHYPNFVCDSCGKVFATKRQIHAHRRIAHSTSEAVRCELCPKTFKRLAYLKSHRIEVHKLGGEAHRSKCPKCPMTFKSYHYRVNHLIEAHGEEPLKYKCKLCPRRFKLSNRLAEHVRRDHLKERNHRCGLCHREFYDNRKLQNHMLKHTGVKNFECEKCGKPFARKHTLDGHMKSHNNVRDHVCSVCGKGFVQKCTLKGHLRTHAKHPATLPPPDDNVAA